jgi:hypothetical protein
MRSLASSFATAASAVILTATPVFATVLKPMNLEELTLKADRIFSGTVTAVEKGRVAIGGGTLPTVTYRIAVDRALAGIPDTGVGTVTEIRMIGDLEEVRRDDRVRVRTRPPRPDIAPGERYLFFVTAPGPAGLSSTVGLGQGCFRVTGEPADEDAVNQFGNAGLFRGMSGSATDARGPVKYAALAERIASLRVRK